MLYEKISILPDDIIQLIFKNIALKKLIFLNKEFYLRLNYLIDGIINTRYNSYVKDIIRNNAAFVFTQILNRQYSNWMICRNYTHTNLIYENYVHFLLNFCKNHHAIKCYNIFITKLNRIEKTWQCKNIRNHWNY